MGELMNAILKDELGDSPETVGLTIGRVVRRCLEKDGEHRFQTAADLGFALEPLPASSPVLRRGRQFLRNRGVWPTAVFRSR